MKSSSEMVSRVDESNIRLSVLVPAYEYLEGVLRICDSVSNALDSIEVIVSDDSPSSALAEGLKKKKYPFVSYHKRNGPNGAPYNWNGLLQKARGEYVVLVHHDEYFNSEQDLRSLINFLTLSESKPDIVILPLKIERRGVSVGYSYLWIRATFAKLVPSLILRVNFVGPTACLVIRRSILETFDPQLKWFVDMDFYSRLFKAATRVVPFGECAIHSESERSESITAGLRDDLANIKSSERQILHRKNHGQHLNGVIAVFATVVWHMSKICALVQATVVDLSRSIFHRF